jgi:copper(I)-binding protein
VSSSLRRGALAASAIAFSIASLAACGAGNNAQTLEIQPDNAATSVGDIKIQNAVVITQPDPEATGPAVVSATVFNAGDSAQTLDRITVDGIEQPVELSPAKGGGKLTIPAGGSVVIGGKDNASAVLKDGEGLEDGDAQKVTFSFSETGDVSMEAFVVPAGGYFSSWGPSEVPAAPGASASTSATPGATPSGEATPSGAADGHATGTATPSGAATASAPAGESAAGHDAAGH